LLKTICLFQAFERFWPFFGVLEIIMVYRVWLMLKLHIENVIGSVKADAGAYFGWQKNPSTSGRLR